MENLVIELLPADYEAIAELWEASVRATHHFLKPEEIGFYKPYLLKYALPACRLYGIKTNEGKLCAFIGLSDDKIEMLFVNPKFFKNGCGRRLVDFAEREKNIKKSTSTKKTRRRWPFIFIWVSTLPAAANWTATASPTRSFSCKRTDFIPVATNNSFLLKFGKL